MADGSGAEETSKHDSDKDTSEPDRGNDGHDSERHKGNSSRVVYIPSPNGRDGTVDPSLRGRSTSLPNCGISMSVKDVRSSKGVPKNRTSRSLGDSHSHTTIHRGNSNSNAAIIINSVTTPHYPQDPNDAPALRVGRTEDESSDDESDEDFRMIEYLQESPLVSIRKTLELKSHIRQDQNRR